MNHFQTTVSNKRVPGQYHLVLCNESTYKGFPVYVHPQGLVTSYLDRLLDIIGSAVKTYTRIFAVRADLRFPIHYEVLDQSLANNYMQAFIKKLRYKLERDKQEKQQLGTRVHDVRFGYAWAREEGPNSGKPHFHLLLLFNGNAFRGIGSFSGDENLGARIGESWTEALGIDAPAGARLVHFPQKGQSLVDSRSRIQMQAVFQRASYLTKVATKNFHDGFHVFGGSRV